MSKEKQIEEMAWDLCDIPKHPSIKSCEQCGNKRCHAMYYAERAYNAGYRKQNDLTPCDVCQYNPSSRVDGVHCWHCPAQAKMKGV